MSIYPFQLQPFSLAGAGVVAGATSLTLKSMLTIDGAPITMADFGTIAYGTLEPGNSSREESFCFTGITSNINGTVTLTGISNVTFGTPFTKTSGLLKSHAGNSEMVISNTSGYESEYPAKQNDETITGQWTFTYPPVSPSSNPDASTTVKGITKLSVAPVAPANPIAVGDNDPRMPTTDEKAALDGTGTPSAANKYVTEDTLATYVPDTDTYQGPSDQSQTTSNATYAVGEANLTTKHSQIAERFIPTQTVLSGVSLWKIADTGSFTGTVTIAIQAEVTASPSGIDLATFTITNANWLKLNAAAEFSITLSSPLTVTAGSAYWIVVRTSTTDDANHPNLGMNTAGGYASGALKYYNPVDSWTLTATSILYFKTLNVSSSKIVVSQTDSLVPALQSRYSFIGTSASSTTATTASVSTVVTNVQYSVELPGGYIGPNSGLMITMIGSLQNRYGNNNADRSNFIVRYNGTQIAVFAVLGGAAAVTGYTSARVTFTIMNQASMTSQSFTGLANGTITTTPPDGPATAYSSVSGSSSADFSQPGLLEIIAQANVSSTSGTISNTVVVAGSLIEKIA